MREILFRGKMDDGEWVEGFLVKMFGVYHIIDKDDENTAYEVIQETVGQHTGLKDKNGKRIFEGDIAKVLQGKDKDIAYVGFENGAFMLYPKTGNIYERTLWEYWYNDWDVEVIGNITDNPELLEK